MYFPENLRKKLSNTLKIAQLESAGTRIQAWESGNLYKVMLISGNRVVTREKERKPDRPSLKQSLGDSKLMGRLRG